MIDRPHPPIRAAIVGYGGSGKLSHAYGLQNNPEFEIAAVCDVSAEKRAEAAQDLGCPVFESHQALLDNSDAFDLVSVVTRSDTHCQVTCDCLNAGLNTLVTKPWALNQAEAKRILEAHQSSGAQLFPWMPMYWSPDYERILSLTRSGAIGDVFLVRRNVSQFWRRGDWQTETRFGGGYLLNWGMHIVQPVLSLVDSPVARVFGMLQQVINPGDADDNFLAVIEFENETRGMAEFTQAVEGLPAFMVQGTRGMILSDDENVTLIQKEPDPAQPESRQTFPIEGKLYGDEAEIYADVARSLLHHAPFRATPELAYYGSVVLDAIRESHRSGETVIPILNGNSLAYPANP